MRADRLQQIEVDLLRVGWMAMIRRGVAIPAISPIGRLGDGVEGPRCPRQLEDLLGNPMHVDGERDAAVADQREAELLAFHEWQRRRAPRREARCSKRSDAGNSGWGKGSRGFRRVSIDLRRSIEASGRVSYKDQAEGDRRLAGRPGQPAD